MEEFVMPGDKIGSIEEMESGNNTFDDGDMIRSTTVGIINIDKKNRIAQVQNGKQLSIPKKGDIVIGSVSAVLSAMIAVSIQYINGKPNYSGVECICQNYDRKRVIARINDIIVLRIESHLNGAIHATVDEPELGVLFTKCNICAGSVVPMRDRVKCPNCGYMEDRKISTNYEKADFIKLRD
ncbi:MAG: exosome complex RNA-binding protein Csl4 [Candidatus Nitrosotenuis sp.]